jgi:hypothetical protein
VTAPRHRFIGTAWEFVDQDRFNLHVEIACPLAGLIVSCEGWLVPRRRESC